MRYYSKAIYMIVIDLVLLILNLISLSIKSSISVVLALLLNLGLFIISGLYLYFHIKERKIAIILVDSYKLLSKSIEEDSKRGYATQEEYNLTFETVQAANEWYNYAIDDLNEFKHNSPYYGLGLDKISMIYISPFELIEETNETVTNE